MSQSQEPDQVRRLQDAKMQFVESWADMGVHWGVPRSMTAVHALLFIEGVPLNMDQMMERLEDTGRHVVHELERFLNTLGTIAAIAPLLGLLGTVTGIMSAFNAINEGAIGDPRMLSGGISEALITTAAGLLVAIPALVAYRYLRGRVDGLVVQMEKQAIALADAVETAGPRPPVRGRAKAAS